MTSMSWLRHIKDRPKSFDYMANTIDKMESKLETVKRRTIRRVMREGYSVPQIHAAIVASGETIALMSVQVMCDDAWASVRSTDEGFIDE